MPSLLSLTPYSLSLSLSVAFPLSPTLTYVADQHLRLNVKTDIILLQYNIISIKITLFGTDLR